MNIVSFNKMSEEIKIKKSDLWKYSAALLVVIIIVGVVFLRGDKSPGSDVKLDAFISDSSLYPSLGPDNADVVVIEFSDFQCPYCALASGLPDFAKQYATQYSDLFGISGKLKEMASDGEIKFIYVSMSFLGSESVYASQAGLCANEQGKFWEMHDAIFRAHDGKENNGKYSKENLKIMAQSISGLDTSEFNNCLDNDLTLADVNKVANSAGSVVTGTPSFFVNGQKVSASWNAVSAAINA
jgi:protein-disulfide isomerase